jgi:hypothetical protein
VLFPCGSTICSPVRCKNLYQTSLAYGHCMGMWSTLSSSCKHVKHTSGLSCRPCLCRLSEVKSLYLSAR